MPKRTNNTTLLRIGLLSGIFLISLIWQPHGVSLCLFHTVTGFECPGCGMTRAFCAISHGQIVEAIHFNLFSIPLYVFFLGILARDIVHVSTGKLIDVPRAFRLEGMYGYAVLVLVLAYSIARNLTSIP